MAVQSNVGRRVHLSQGTRAARRRAAKLLRACQAGGVGSGPSTFEQLEGRLLMSAVRPDAAFMSQDLLVGDEKSFPTLGSVGYSLGFSAPINFYDGYFSGLFVNNNGNVTLGGRSSFFFDADLDSVSSKMIAPFYADVDTRFAGSTVKFGQGMVDGHRAFAVDWIDVDFSPSNVGHDGHNTFQLVLIEREDVAPGDFDMEFNYDHISWESGARQGGDGFGFGGSAARVGWTAFDFDASHVFQMPGSNQPGTFLDDGTAPLVAGKFMSDVDGRYVFRFRGGTWADAPSGEVVNHDPVVTMPNDTLRDEGPNGTTELSMTGVFDDVDADTWTVTVDYGDGSDLETLAYDEVNMFRLQHTYTHTGLFLVQVTVDDGNGGVGTGMMGFAVQDYSAPTVDVSAPAVVREGESAVFTASTANDTDANDTYTYRWTLDGVVTEGPTFTFHADDNGSHTLHLAVSDDSGNTTDRDLVVNVQNVAPTATGLSGNATLNEGGTLNVGLNGASDVSSADLSAGLTYSFDFDGDGVFDVVGASPLASHVYGDNGSHVVRARVSDKDGGYNDYTMAVDVRNVAPTATLSSSGALKEGNTVTVSLGGVADASAADLAAGLVYSFDLDGDGVYELSGGSPVASLKLNDNGTRLVRGRVTDKDGGSSTYQLSLVVANVAPTAAGLVGGTVVEGGSVTLRLDGASDVPADVAAGLTYSFDVNNDGVFDVTGSSATLSRAFANDGSYTVRARVSDKDGGYSDYTTTVVVQNAAPALTGFTSSAAALGNAAEGSSVSVSGSFTDAGVLDRHTAVIDWGDGTSSTAGVSESNGKGTLSGSHVYTQGGVYAVNVRLVDDATPAGAATGSAPAVVTGVGLQNGVLNIVGTNGADKVTVVSDNKGNITVRGDVTKRNVSFAGASVREVRATLGAGKDTFDTQGSFSQPIYLNGVRYAPPTKGNATLSAKMTSITKNLFSNKKVA